MAGSGPLPGENPCCPCHGVGIIFKERAKGGRDGSNGQWEVDGHLILLTPTHLTLSEGLTLTL